MDGTLPHHRHCGVVLAHYRHDRSFLLLDTIMTVYFICQCELVPDIDMPHCEDCTPTDEAQWEWENQMATCQACGTTYPNLAGHSCGDAGNAHVLRDKLAQEMEQRQQLEQQLTELKKRLLPLAKWASGDYNKWRVKNPKAPTYADACKALLTFVKDAS